MEKGALLLGHWSACDEQLHCASLGFFPGFDFLSAFYYYYYYYFILGIKLFSNREFYLFLFFPYNCSPHPTARWRSEQVAA